LQVEIPENPTTGYRWELTAEPRAAIEILKDEYSRKSAGVGAGGIRIWTIRLKVPASVHLKALLRQPWLPESDPEDAAALDLEAFLDSNTVAAG
jgi:inhibitor of cysteine peptidase